jgi:hypothetical protein
VEELARMLGGAKITARTREHAREMLEAVSRAAARANAGARPTSIGKGTSRVRSGRARSANGR